MLTLSSPNPPPLPKNVFFIKKKQCEEEWGGPKNTPPMGDSRRRLLQGAVPEMATIACMDEIFDDCNVMAIGNCGCTDDADAEISFPAICAFDVCVASQNTATKTSVGEVWEDPQYADFMNVKILSSLLFFFLV